MTILSLVLCLATLALWVRSYWRYDSLALVYGSRRFGAQSQFCELSFNTTRVRLNTQSRLWRSGWYYSTGGSDAQDTLRWEAERSPAPGVRQFAGFGYVTDTSPAASLFYIWFPHWFFALLFAALPATQLRSILRTRRRNRVGLCQHCGYDLRASPDRCPECGHAASTAASG